MKHEDDLDVDKADLKRKNSSPSIMIGTSRRVIMRFILSFPNKDWTRLPLVPHTILLISLNYKMPLNTQCHLEKHPKDKIQSSRQLQQPLSLVLEPTSKKLSEATQPHPLVEFHTIPR